MKRLLRRSLLGLCLLVVLASANFLFRSAAQAARPAEFDVRGPQGVPKGTALHAPTLAQVKALTALQSKISQAVNVDQHFAVIDRQTIRSLLKEHDRRAHVGNISALMGISRLSSCRPPHSGVAA